MDLTESIAPRSDQLNSDDLITGPVTVTITEVKAGNPEQPVEVHLQEFPGRPYKPSKSMRRVLVQAWGAEASTYTGRRLTLFRNPEITFGRDKVGGIEVSHMSDLPKRLTVSLMVTRGKRKPFSVDPLPDAPKGFARDGYTGDGIPDEVVSNTEKALKDGALGDYLAWLTEQGAPAHIRNYVNERMPA